MRTPLVLLFGSLLAGCMVGDPGTGDDDGTGGGGNAICGNNIKEAGEACDDGNTVGNDGCSATCTVEAAPDLQLAVDKPLITTELRTTNMATVTLMGSGGFNGAVTLSGSVVNAQNALIPGWTVGFNETSFTLGADGTKTVVATITIPSDNRVPGAGAAPKIDGVLKIDAQSSLGTKTITSQISAANQVSLNVTMTGGLCTYTQVMGITKLTVGTKVRMVNKGTDPMIFHSDGNTTNGVPHQNTATTTAVNASYDNTILTAGSTFGWYCHSPGPNPNNNGTTAVGIQTVAAVP